MNIKVVKVEPHKKPELVEIDNGLESLYKAIGCEYIECVYPFDEQMCIVCDEEGKLNRRELNRSLRDENGEIYDIIANTFLVVGLDDNCDEFVSISDENASKVMEMFESTEIFGKIDGKIYSMKF